MIMDGQLPASFRDPSGFIFMRNGSLYRQINGVYSEDYLTLMQSGLYDALLKDSLLVQHDEVDLPPQAPGAFRIIRPEVIPFISYPYEWCFSQLKDAALTTLKIQKKALKHGMTLKDASAFNIQFKKGKPLLIDTLSFEKYREGSPWVAYRQFCQHFLAPLSLMSYTDVRLNQMLRIHLDGIPLDIAHALLPWRTRFKYSTLTHIHLQHRVQRHFADKAVDEKRLKVGRFGLMGIIASLESAVKKLKWKPEATEWGDYYEDTNYSPAALQHKKDIVSAFLLDINPASVWDMGANTGVFSRIASEMGLPTVSFDIDPAAVEKSYIEVTKKGEMNILPLVLDLTNPSPAIGWAHQERMSLIERGPVDAVFAFALIHHLAISNNLSFSKIAEFFSRICRYLIIEYIPKSDSQVQRLLRTRKDVFTDYGQQSFEKELSRNFIIKERVDIRESERTLYLMKNLKDGA